MTLFAFFAFWPAALAAGIGAISIPVIIHLINRRRYKIVPWAAMKFLLAAQKQTRKRMRIEQLLLLLVRMMILALIVFAMWCVMPLAEGFWAELGLANFTRGGQRSQRIHHLIVLDASLSMNQTVAGQSAFETAKQLAIKKIQDNPSGDAYTVLLLKDSPTWLVSEVSQDARKVMREIEAIKPSHGNSALPASLSMISAKLSEAKRRFPAQAVYFFTDMQKTTWMEGAIADHRVGGDQDKRPYLEIDKNAATVFVDVGTLDKHAPGNIAVSNLSFDEPFVTSGSEQTLTVSLEYFGQEPKQDVRVEVLIGKAKENANDAPLNLRVVKQETIALLANGQKEVRIPRIQFPGPGTYAVQAKVSGDPLEPDDARTIIITVRETIPVLIVNGKPHPDRFEQASEFVKLALNPFEAGDEMKKFPLRPRVVSPSTFSELKAEELKDFDCIFWCDVGQFGEKSVRNLETHLRGGGGVVVSMGDQAAKSLDLYNRLLHKEDHEPGPGKLLLPGKLMKVIQAPAEHYYRFNSSEDSFKLPPLHAFNDDLYRLSLRNARFDHFVETIVPDGKARNILTFMPEALSTSKVKLDAPLPVNLPALLEWNPPLARAHQPAANPAKPGGKAERQPVRHRGKVILFTSTLNKDWTLWPISVSFGAMVNELTRHAVSGRLREHSTSVGATLEDYLPGAAEVDVKVHYPPALTGAKPVTRRTQMIDEVNLFRFEDTDFSGVYRVETATGEIPFAVNVPGASAEHKGSESDLTRVDEAKLQESYPGWRLKVVRDPLEAIITGNIDDPVDLLVAQPVGPFLANVCILLMLGFLFLEILLAWWFGHYTTAEGTVAPGGVSNFTSTVTAGVIAVLSTIFFAIGASIIAHHIYTGDFLSFLPDVIRTFVEKEVGVPKPAPGEGTNWRLEPLPFLFDLLSARNERWMQILISLGAIATIFFTYKAEAPKVSFVYKMLLGALRLYLILLTIWFLLPKPELRFNREAWPDLVLLIDDSRSMGESDAYKDAATIERAKKLGESIREKLLRDVPEKVQALKAEYDAKEPMAKKDPDLNAELEGISQRLKYWKDQQNALDAKKWRPSRLQLVQAIMAQDEPHWLKTLQQKYKSKVHVFHLDATGRATKLRGTDGEAGEIVDPTQPKQIDAANDAISKLEPVGNDSRLGTAVRQVIDQYRGSALASVIMFTDGVTTRDETIAQVGEYAGQKGISLFFIGLGDDRQLRDLKLSDLQVEDPIYLGDRAIFEFRLTGQGYTDLSVPVVLKVKTKDGKEKEVARETLKIDPTGKSVRGRLSDQPKEIGRKTYIIEIEAPKLEPNDKPLPQSNLRLERTIEVIDIKQIRVLYVEGQPRYEFRYIKFLMERELSDVKKNKSIELKVLLLDADPDFAKTDATAISTFPANLDELNRYDVVILGDCDPNHAKLKNSLKDIKNYVTGETDKGTKGIKPGGGLLFIAGAFHNPHHYKGTPLADVIPVEPLQNNPPQEVLKKDIMRPELTPAGRMHPIFRFSPDDGDNMVIWNKLQPMFWNSTAYKIKPLAEVLAVHPTDDALGKRGNQDKRHPLVVQQFVGTGRSMFFGFDETWRWRLREDEAKFNNFWIQTMRYLSRGRSTRTDLRLDRQSPYFPGETIKVTVRFPDNTPGGSNQPGPKINEKTEVKVTVTYTPTDGKERESDVRTMTLAKAEGSWGTYDGPWIATRDGKYRFRLTNPDVSATQPDGEKPSAEAIVELPPGELDNLRMNQQDLNKAADATQGKVFTLANADQALLDLPMPASISIASPSPPTMLWNQWWVFVAIIFLITSEWVLRKFKHLL